MIQLRERINITKPAIGGMIQHTGAFGGALESLNVLFDVLGVVAQASEAFHGLACLVIDLSILTGAPCRSTNDWGSNKYF